VTGRGIGTSTGRSSERERGFLYQSLELDTAEMAKIGALGLWIFQGSSSALLTLDT